MHLLYLVAQDQPLISLIGVHWTTDPDQPPSDGDEVPPEWEWTLAA